MRKLIAAIVFSLLAACVSQPPYRYAGSTGAYVAAGPILYHWPLVYRTRMFPGWYGSNPYYAYWGFPSPWGFYYYSPNFYPYHFSVAYSLWPDYYGSGYDPRVPWRPPYRGHWHPYPAGVPAPVAGASTGVSGADAIRGAYRTRAPGRPNKGSQAAQPRATGGLDALYAKGTAYYGRSDSGSYPGKQGSSLTLPSITGRTLAPSSAIPAPPTAATAAPAMRPMTPARARNPAGRSVSPARSVWQKD